MSSFYKDLNYELTQHNQRMRMELCSYRNEMIKVKQDLMQQREANALLKNSLTAEFLKVSKSLNIIFTLLENTCNDSIDETINEINNSISKLDNTDYSEGASQINTTITPKKRDNIGVVSTLAKDLLIVDNASLSNFSFEVENEDTTIAETVDMNVLGSSELVGLTPTFPLDVGADESVLDESAMSVIEEDTENSGNEASVHCKVNPVPKTSTLNNSSIVEDSFKKSLTPPKHRSTTITRERLSDRFTLNKTSLRGCSVLLHPIKMESLLKQSPSSTFNNTNILVISTNEEKLIISTNEEKISKENEENVELLFENKHKKIIKSPERRLPRRKAAPKVLTEQNNKSKMRRE